MAERITRFPNGRVEIELELPASLVDPILSGSGQDLSAYIAAALQYGLKAREKRDQSAGL